MALNILLVVHRGFPTYLRFLYSKTNDNVVKYCTVLNNMAWLYHFREVSLEM